MNLEEIKTIKMKGGKAALVDADMFDFLNQWKWCIDSNGYARISVGYKRVRKAVFMHHLVLGLVPSLGIETDHINGIRLDNRRENLRTCTKSQNAKNTKGWSNKKTSRFKGVFKRNRSQRWRAIITCNRKRYHLGDFSTEIAAAKAYNEAAEKLFGEFASLNDLSPITNGKEKKHENKC